VIEDLCEQGFCRANKYADTVRRKMQRESAGPAIS